MNRITAKFDELAGEGRKGLVGYMTAGDPDPRRSERNIRVAIESGLDILELGMPFSDPTADGPVIQAAAMRALASGMNIGRYLDMIRSIRADYDIPIVVFGYANPFFRYGYELFCAEAAGAGADGMLVVDIPFEESYEIKECLERNGMFFIPLIAPTTPQSRISALLENAGGFVYYIMVTGVTGVRSSMAVNLAERIQTLRRATALPIAAGFGISNGTQAASAAGQCDAVVAGSALVDAAGKGEYQLRMLVGELRLALDGRA